MLLLHWLMRVLWLHDWLPVLRLHLVLSIVLLLHVGVSVARRLHVVLSLARLLHAVLSVVLLLHVGLLVLETRLGNFGVFRL